MKKGISSVREYEKLREEMNYYTPVRMEKEKADKIFALAWVYGHADGAEAVKEYYQDIINVARL